MATNFHEMTREEFIEAVNDLTNKIGELIQDKVDKIVMCSVCEVLITILILTHKELKDLDINKYKNDIFDMMTKDFEKRLSDLSLGLEDKESI